MFFKTYSVTWVAICIFTLFPASSAASDKVERLITAGGSVTDIVFAVGGGNRVIGVDTSSTSPAAVEEVPKIGYYRSLSAEGVLSFEPGELWVLEGGGSEQTLNQIEQIGVKVVHFAKPTNLTDLYQLIEDVAGRLGLEERGQQVIASIKQEFNPVTRSTPITGLFVLQASERGVVAAGKDTVADLLFQHSDIDNTFEHKGFLTVSSEYLVANEPDFIVAPAHIVNGHGGADAFCATQALQLLEAGRSCRLLVMDSLLALGMTTRIAEAHRLLLDYANDL